MRGGEAYPLVKLVMNDLYGQLTSCVAKQGGTNDGMGLLKANQCAMENNN